LLTVLAPQLHRRDAVSLLTLRRPPTSTLLPYPTLFRSQQPRRGTAGRTPGRCTTAGHRGGTGGPVAGPAGNGQVAPGVSFVDGDNIGGARAVVEHLIALGHRRIACISSASGLVATRHRLEGYRQVMVAAGLPVDERWIVDGAATRQGDRQAMAMLLARGLGREEDAPTAVFAANDVMAIGAMVAAREAGLLVPRYVSIAGFDGIAVTELVEPALTTVQQPIYELGTTLADVLLDLLERAHKSRRRSRAADQQVGAVRPARGRRHEDVLNYVRREVLPCRLVVRGSAAPP